jgi:hypothetical protein
VGDSLTDLSKAIISMVVSQSPFLSHHLTSAFRSSSKSWASPHASACLSSIFSSPSVSPAPTRLRKPEANCVRYMVDAYLLNLWAELTWQCHRGIHYLYTLDFFERTIFLKVTPTWTATDILGQSHLIIIYFIPNCATYLYYTSYFQ